MSTVVMCLCLAGMPVGTRVPVPASLASPISQGMVGVQCPAALPPALLYESGAGRTTLAASSGLTRGLWIGGLSIGFAESLLLGLFAFDSKSPGEFLLHLVPSALVLAPTILALWYPRTGGIILGVEGIALAGVMALGHGTHWSAYALLPAPMVVSGTLLFFGESSLR